MTKKTAFIITKPLQFMVAASVIEQCGIAGETDLLVVDGFSDADGFVHRYEQREPVWGAIKFFPDHNSALRHARRGRYQAVYLDSDVSTARFISLSIQKIVSPFTKIGVYEEGIGTYRSDLYSGMKQALLRATGVGTYFGGSIYTSTIFVYDPQAYISSVGLSDRRSVIEIIVKLPTFIQRNLSALRTLFAFEPPQLHPETSDVNLYLTSWTVDYKFLESFASLPGTKIVKPHPHIRNEVLKLAHGIQLVGGGSPAELLMLFFLGQGRRVRVFHHGSSAPHYLADTGIEFVHINHAKAERHIARS